MGEIEEYLKTLKEPLGKRTVCFLVKGDKVLLGKKKRGLGEGNYLGIGGKVHAGEKVEEAAVREMLEETEIRVKAEDLEEFAVLKFLFPNKPEWSMEVHAFIAREWAGEAKETEEIRPEWFEKGKIPYELMWDDNKHWIGRILAEEKLRADFLYGENKKIKFQSFAKY